MVEGSRTELELLNAFAGESMARNRYTMYAKIAKKEGFEEISKIFLETADNEKEHAKLFYEYIPKGIKTVNADYPFFIGTTQENLKAAADGEKDEWETIYPNSAQVALSEGYKEIGELFKHIIQVEKHHSYRYSKILKELKDDTLYKKEYETQWKCQNCGYILISKCAPEICPLCKHEQGYFQLFCEKF